MRRGGLAPGTETTGLAELEPDLAPARMEACIRWASARPSVGGEPGVNDGVDRRPLTWDRHHSLLRPGRMSRSENGPGMVVVGLAVGTAVAQGSSRVSQPVSTVRRFEPRSRSPVERTRMLGPGREMYASPVVVKGGIDAVTKKAPTFARCRCCGR